MVDAATKASVGKIPILKTKAGPRDKEAWVARLKEEYVSLIQYVQNNKESDTDWFRYLKLQNYFLVKVSLICSYCRPILYENRESLLTFQFCSFTD